MFTRPFAARAALALLVAACAPAPAPEAPTEDPTWRQFVSGLTKPAKDPVVGARKVVVELADGEVVLLGVKAGKLQVNNTTVKNGSA